MNEHRRWIFYQIWKHIDFSCLDRVIFRAAVIKSVINKNYRWLARCVFRHFIPLYLYYYWNFNTPCCFVYFHFHYFLTLNPPFSIIAAFSFLSLLLNYGLKFYATFFFATLIYCGKISLIFCFVLYQIYFSFSVAMKLIKRIKWLMSEVELKKAL